MMARMTSRRARRLGLQIASFVVLMVAWEQYAATVNPVLMAQPSAILAAAFEVILVKPVIPAAFVISMTSLFTGLGLAIPAGIFVGVLLGRVRTLEFAADPYIWFLYALPSIALIPVFVIWFGIGIELRIFMVFVAAFFPILIYTMAGVKSVSNELLDIGRAFCANERQLARTIVLPSALPMIFSGIRVALGSSLIGVIVVEMVVLITGLGGLLVEYANSYRTAYMFVPIFVMMALAILLTKASGWAQSRLTPWHRAAVSEEGL